MKNNTIRKSILHCHYSGIVRNSTLLNYLIDNENVDLNRRNSVVFSSASLSNKEKSKLRHRIEHLYTHKRKHDNMFNIVGNLWYYIIKDIDFFEKYNLLIIKEMKFQDVKHIEFRIKLGSHFKKGGNRISIEKELIAFYNVQRLYKKNNVSFKIICQISKSSNRDQVFGYFSEILDVLKRRPKFDRIISGFDITGDEVGGNSLVYYKDVIERLGENYKDTIKPFFFHAGECDSKKCRDNIKFALKYGGKRIAHGIYSVGDRKLMDQIIRKNVLLEIAPLSNFYLNNLNDPFIFHKLYKYGVKMCINTDDPNKLNDTSLVENEEFLLRHGFTREQLGELYLNALKYI